MHNAKWLGNIAGPFSFDERILATNYTNFTNEPPFSKCEYC